MARLEEKDRRIAALENQLAALSDSKYSLFLLCREPVQARLWTPPGATCPYCRRGYASLPHNLGHAADRHPPAPTVSPLHLLLAPEAMLIMGGYRQVGGGEKGDKSMVVLSNVVEESPQRQQRRG